MRSRTSLCIAVLLATLGAVTVGCGPEPTPPPDPVTITFESPVADQEGHEALVGQFNEEHAWVTVELQRTMSGKGDVLVVPTYMLPFLQEDGGLLDLSAYAESDEAFAIHDLVPEAVEMASSDGRLWAIPYGVDPFVVYYNLDLLEGAGAPLPDADWTWDDLLTIAAAVRDERAAVFGYASTDPVLDALAIIYAHGGWVLDDMVNPTRSTLDDPRVIEALTWYEALIHRYNVAPTSEQMRGEAFMGQPAIGIYTGHVALWSGFFSERGGSPTASSAWPGVWPMRWGIAPFPRQERRAALAAVNAYAVRADSEDPQACWEWIRYLSLHPAAGAIPARRSVLESKAYERLVGEEDARLAREAMAEVRLLSPDLGAFAATFEALGRVMYRITEG